MKMIFAVLAVTLAATHSFADAGGGESQQADPQGGGPYLAQGPVGPGTLFPGGTQGTYKIEGGTLILTAQSKPFETNCNSESGCADPQASLPSIQLQLSSTSCAGSGPQGQFEIQGGKVVCHEGSYDQNVGGDSQL